MLAPQNSPSGQDCSKMTLQSRATYLGETPNRAINWSGSILNGTNCVHFNIANNYWVISIGQNFNISVILYDINMKLILISV